MLGVCWKKILTVNNLKFEHLTIKLFLKRNHVTLQSRIILNLCITPGCTENHSPLCSAQLSWAVSLSCTKRTTPTTINMVHSNPSTQLILPISWVNHLQPAPRQQQIDTD